MDFPTKLGLALALTSFGLSLIFFFVPYEWKAMPRWLSRGGLAVGALVALASGGVLILVPPEAVPDVVLKFVYQKEPAVLLLNLSNAVAREVKYSAELWNLSKPTERTPLLIPISTFDFIRPHESGGPQNIFSLPNVGSSLKDGDALFGYASVGCPTCSQWHFFWVFIEWHKGGYFCELRKGTVPQLINLMDALPQLAKSPRLASALCPPGQSQEIKDLPH